MFLRSLAVFAMLVSAQFASAQGVAMKKAMKAGDEKIAEAVAKVKSSCGNGSLKASADYASVQKMTEFAKTDGRTMENMVEVSGDVLADYVDRLASLCEDADYKPEVAKVTEIKFVADLNQNKGAFSKSGNVITIKAHPTHAADSFETGPGFKKLF